MIKKSSFELTNVVLNRVYVYIPFRLVSFVPPAFHCSCYTTAFSASCLLAAMVGGIKVREGSRDSSMNLRSWSLLVQIL